jgi:phosphoribosylanthranilate isomerase
MRIKICGITRATDAQGASVAGADFLGFNFYPASPRHVGNGPVAELLAAVEPPAVAVAVTVNAEAALLDELTAPGERVGPRPFAVVQMHGDEPAELADYAIGRGAKVIKAFRVRRADFADEVRRWVEQVDRRAGLLAVLLDAAPADARQYGGSGRRFEWQWLADAREAGALEGLPPILLAGGLTVATVGKAARIARPWGVDVAGGVEVEDSPGIKSLDRVRAFIRNARLGKA